MSKSKEFRELQVSSGQLAAVILSLLALCVFVFFLGTRVGSKKGLLAASGIPTGAKPENVVAPRPVSPDPTLSTLPAETGAPELKTVSERSRPAETPPGGKTGAVTEASLKPPDPMPTPGPKAKSQPEARPVLPNPKTETSNPPAANKPAAGKPAAAPTGVLFIQVAALDARASAETFARKIEALGFSVLVLDPLAGDKRTVYRVRIGPYETKAEAEAARTKLAAALKNKKTDYFIVKG